MLINNDQNSGIDPKYLSISVADSSASSHSSVSFRELSMLIGIEINNTILIDIDCRWAMIAGVLMNDMRNPGGKFV